MVSFKDALAASVEYFGGDEMAADVFIKKYALRDENHELLEMTPDDMHRRLAREFARIEAKYPNPMSEDEIFELLRDFRYIVPQGSPMSGIGNDYSIQSLSNCFVIKSPYDSYGGILYTDQEQVQIMKRRGGVGFDISTIRPAGLITSNASRTTDGIAVFMQRFSNSCREVAQGGRRGALMLTLDIRHPDVETFIDIKKDLTKITGANISLRVSDEFMKAVEDDSDFTLQWPVDAIEPTYTRTVKARQIWDKIIDSAWSAAEPGVLFWDTVKRETPADIFSDEGFGSVSTNPCIVGETLIAVADGRNAVSIKSLADVGQDVPVYSTNPTTGRVEIKMGRNPRKTGEMKEVWKLILDDGSSLIATPDHKVMLKTLEYVELSKLKAGMSVFPFYSFNSNGYRQVANTGADMAGGAKRNRRQYRLINEFYHGDVDAKNIAIHHIDFDSTNDNISNLQLMTHEEHRALHADCMRGAANPYHRMTAEQKHNFASHPGEKNGRYLGVTNDELIEHGRKALSENGRLTVSIWTNYAKQHGLPCHVANEFRFKRFSAFKDRVINNHKVVSVEFFGYEDVFNITVDDNHNYHVITSGSPDDKFIQASGLCVKNCGEIVLSPYDSCRLLVVNALSYVRNAFTEDATFDLKLFNEHAVKAQRLMDDLIDIEIEHIDAIIKKVESDPEPDDIKAIETALWQKIRDACVKGRRTGLGLTGVGDTLAYLNIRYGSKESILMIEELYRSLAVAANKSSVQLAVERGAFPICDVSRMVKHQFISRLLDASDAETRAAFMKYGRRNICLTTTAPAGSVSLMTRTTSGIEPAYMLQYVRRRKLTQNDVGIRVDFEDSMGDKWQEYDVFHPGFKHWRDVSGLTDVKSSPYHMSTSNDVDWVASVDVQAVAQRWIEHSLSKTCNLPASTTRDVVAQVYMRAWKTGCKGFTVYRDGCRAGVLVSAKTNDVAATTKTTRPKELPCEIHHANIKGEAWTILVGMIDEKPYEIFGGLSRFVEIPKKYDRGLIIKNERKTMAATYDLRICNGSDITIKDIVEQFDNPNHSVMTRMISLALRQGAPIQQVVEQLQKGDRDSDMFSFAKVLSRVLKGYIVDGAETDIVKKCDSCGGTKFHYSEGCVSCSSCGWSRC